ncbi:hypothetical protein JCM19240_3817 [Vibrio maritimus]|uniref:Uncharacterized protein n=1 Tax=Vibrio maritimus TaxID=990268 RepID=A0A090TA97_9VIBR|nr:hypothetical protein JCM19240_3817 [Vibrio maritimus]
MDGVNVATGHQSVGESKTVSDENPMFWRNFVQSNEILSTYN